MVDYRVLHTNLYGEQKIMHTLNVRRCPAIENGRLRIPLQRCAVWLCFRAAYVNKPNLHLETVTFHTKCPNAW